MTAFMMTSKRLVGVDWISAGIASALPSISILSDFTMPCLMA